MMFNTDSLLFLKLQEPLLSHNLLNVEDVMDTQSGRLTFLISAFLYCKYLKDAPIETTRILRWRTCANDLHIKLLKAVRAP